MSAWVILTIDFKVKGMVLKAKHYGNVQLISSLISLSKLKIFAESIEGES